MINREKELERQVTELTKRIEAIEQADAIANIKGKYKELFKKPKPKKIDMSVMVGSDIDCEFDYNQKGQSWISQIVEIRNKQFMDTQGNFASWCRVRENHWYYWDGGECPLPDGLKIRVILRDKSVYEDLSSEVNWKHTEPSDGDIIAFKVIGVADNYTY